MLLAPLLLLLLVAAGNAATFNVNSTDDLPDANPGDGACETALGNDVCTLRAAIQEANATPGYDALNLQANAQYLLTRSGSDDTSLSGSLDIRDSVDIVGAGAASTIIDGNNIDRVIRVLPCIGNGGSCALGKVVASMSGITIRHGSTATTCSAVPCYDVDGGGIYSSMIFTNGQWQGAILTLTNCVIEENSAFAGGGGIYVGGQLTLINSAVANNTANFGGGIAVQPGGLSLVVKNSTVSGNSAGQGGGIFVYIQGGGGAQITNSTISGNHALLGGGIYTIDTGDLWLNVVNSTISGNSSSDDGGGLFASGGTTSLFNVTIAGNTANSDKSDSGIGGGVYNRDGAALNFTNSIIANNYHLTSTLFSVLDDCAGALDSQGYNIVSHACTISGSYSTTPPLLGALQNNGGPTQTNALRGGSPAIDAGNPGGCRDQFGAILTIDQRGLPRPDGTACDIGSYEVQDLIYRNGFEA
jgi:CSLREA domain-containing protein